MKNPIYHKYKDVRHLIEDADLLLFHRAKGLSNLPSKLIAVSGRSDFTHAALAVWIRDSDSKPRILMCAEVREFKGGRLVTLSSQVESHPGLIAVFKTNPSNRWTEFDRGGAARLMIRKAGEKYGWWDIGRASFSHLPIVRLFSRGPDTDDSDRDGHSEFCSESVSNALRRGGLVDPVPNLADSFTEPGDLARSDLFEYQFTLVP